MSIEERLIAALKPIVAAVEPNVYLGDALEYIAFNYTEMPTDYADNRPHAIRYLIQVHWYLPAGRRPTEKRRQIKAALVEAGFLYPVVTNASDGDGQHYVFETEGLDGEL